MQNYRNLLAWQKAHLFALGVHRTTEAWSKRGHSGLVGQVRRAALSIPSNIAEGAARGSDKDFAGFLQVAIGSCTEAEYQLQFASESGVGSPVECRELMEKAQEVRRMLVGLRKRLVGAVR